jgi:hypothetical protein
MWLEYNHIQEGLPPLERESMAVSRFEIRSLPE